ncbi:MAG: YbjQ family protein [Ktedonobacterales bacterium]
MNPQYPQQQYPQQAAQPYPQQPMPFNHALVTSAFELPGVTIVRNYGIVRGIIVRSRSVVGNIGASFQTLFGGNISIYTELCEQARREAYELMIQHAAELGANAIIGVRYDATEITQGVSEVLCYGTAVTVAQKAQ